MSVRSKLVAAFFLGAIAMYGTTAAAENIFNDVPPSHWAYPFIQWAYDAHIMTGPGGQTRMFDPSRPANRAEVAAVAARLYEKLHGEIDEVSRYVNYKQGSSSSRRSSAMSRHSSSRMSMRSSSSLSRYTVRRSSSSSSVISGTLRTFTVPLRGAEETPPVTTSMHGTGTFKWNGKDLSYDITVEDGTGSGSVITAAHFHRGVRGQPGIVLEPITFTGNHAVGTWTDLSQNEIDALESGQIYVNVHTQANPNGEIRGQLLMQ